MNLFLAELRRFTSRRIFRIPIMVFFGLLAIGVVILIAQSVLTDPEPRRVVHDDFADDFQVIFLPFNFWLSLLAVVVGSSSLGAEFGVASLSTQLLFEPRRVRVLLSKAAALVVGYATFTIVLLTIIAAMNFGNVNKSGGTSWPRVLADGAQIVAVSSLFALVAFSITTFTRKTAGAVFSIFGLFLVEFLFLSRFDWIQAKLPITRLLSIVVFSTGTDTFGDEIQTDLFASFMVGSIWTAVFLTASCAYFSRTEIR